MPTYDYRCDACGHAFELFQSIKADPIKTCPKCGADQARRVIGAGGGLIFKGSGFYITDYTRSSDYKEKTKSDGPGGGSPAGKPGEKSGGSSGDSAPKKAAPDGGGGSGQKKASGGSSAAA